MRIVSWLVPLSLLLAHPAALHAQECRIDKDCVLPDGTIIPKLIDYSGKWSWSAGAASRADGTLTPDAGAQHSTAATAALELAYAGPLCRWFGLNSELSAYHASDDHGYSGYQALTFCLPYPVFTPEVTISYERDLRPRLGATPSVAASRVGRFGIGMRVSTFTLRSEEADVSFLPMSVRTSFVSQDVDGVAVLDQDTGVEFSMVAARSAGQGFAGADKELAIVLVRVQMSSLGPADEMAPAYSSSAVIDLLLADVAGARVGSTDWYYDAALGGVFGNLYAGEADEDMSVTHVHPSIDARVMRGSAFQSQGVAYQHSMQTSTYSALVAEDRLSGWVRTAGAEWSATMTGYAAFTQFIEREDGRDITSERIPSGGLGAQLEYFPVPRVRVGFEAELARSFYALLDGQAPRDPGWAGRVGLSVGVQAGSEP